MIKLCVFDLDGTLIDSLLDLAKSMNESLKENGYPAKPEEEYRFLVGDGLSALVDRAAAPSVLSHREKEKIVFSFHQNYQKNCYERTKPYPGIVSLLTTLKNKGIRLGVLSNKPDEFVKKIVPYFFEESLFIEIEGNRSELPRKPDPLSLLQMLDCWGIEKQECLYVGDSDVDVKTAKNAGVISCGVLWGFRGYEELKTQGADFLIEHPDDLLKVIF